ncbi:MAG: type II secretion system protein, partial [bacterium]
MTYVELIIVLSIFSVLSSVAMFSYGDFQAKVDIKNLASEIALRIVEAQKSALSGKLPLQIYSIGWKPSYGVLFNSSVDLDADGIPFNEKFVNFVDINSSNFFNGSNCTGECLDYVNITKANYISKIEECSNDSCVPGLAVTLPIAVTFKRPNSSAIFSTGENTDLTGFDYIQITVLSPRGATSLIKIYPSGRVQVD